MAMGIFALVGIVSLVLASAITVALPLCLAIMLSPAWLWLYGGYAVIIVMLGFIVANCLPDDKRRDGNADN